jgi:hypothetical protein
MPIINKLTTQIYLTLLSFQTKGSIFSNIFQLIDFLAFIREAAGNRENVKRETANVKRQTPTSSGVSPESAAIGKRETAIDNRQLTINNRQLAT